MIGPWISTPSSTNLLTILLTDSGDIASGGCTPGGSISGSFNHSSMRILLLTRSIVPLSGRHHYHDLGQSTSCWCHLFLGQILPSM